MINTVRRLIPNFILLITLIYFALFAGWYVCYSNYFFFPVVYELEDIHGHVLEYAPQNRRGRADFVYVSPAYHLRIFGEMLHAVEHGGEGLAQISYPAGRGKKKFLTGAEQTHLQDVANLLTAIRSVWYLMLAGFAASVVFMSYKKIRPYSMRTISLGTVVCGGVLYVFLSVFGFEKIFYRLHELVFPAGHKWFFYYQDSLMSTMLKAPDSFADMGLIMGAVSLGLFIVVYKLIQFGMNGFICKN
ncbi:hypothetical protein Dacet_0320 [Denitrovibrio acetiphilus DSM 12809]|uniref:Integral membrane protein TIGR01906 n=1 Tax=Denitrovibrio acetiphilus (strain DSM 12809 / NBRC 114555 / N2460) TaxID=522772 RepID=D4H2Q9_DENA2|nr:DUF1461 domain-containing protein [Denitrovibrio acetiphilus]ADD67120.1 hypothetical protein Dacet_0320 [Denitrovibrio acetiphilus DSM 12809]